MNTNFVDFCVTQFASDAQRTNKISQLVALLQEEAHFAANALKVLDNLIVIYSKSASAKSLPKDTTAWRVGVIRDIYRGLYAQYSSMMTVTPSAIG